MFRVVNDHTDPYWNALRWKLITHCEINKPGSC
jgi:hypothetical protein